MGSLCGVSAAQAGRFQSVTLKCGVGTTPPASAAPSQVPLLTQEGSFRSTSFTASQSDFTGSDKSLPLSQNTSAGAEQTSARLRETKPLPPMETAGFHRRSLQISREAFLRSSPKRLRANRRFAGFPGQPPQAEFVAGFPRLEHEN